MGEQVKINIKNNYDILDQLMKDYMYISNLFEKMKRTKSSTPIERLKVIRDNYHSIVDDKMIKLVQDIKIFFDSIEEETNVIIANIINMEISYINNGFLYIVHRDIDQYMECIQKVHSILNNYDKPSNNCIGHNAVCSVLDAVKAIPRPVGVEDGYYILEEVDRIINKTVDEVYSEIEDYFENGSVYVQVE